MAEASTGRRARNKAEKRQRIAAAAWELFRRQGFEATATRDVAEAADVAVGTLFLYARDKHELLFLAYGDRLAEIDQAAFAAVPVAQPLLEAMGTVFTTCFRFHHRHAGLARHLIAGMFVPGGTEQARIREQAFWFIERLAELISAAVVRGELQAGLDARRAAFNSFAIYHTHLLGVLGGFLPLRRTLETDLPASLRQWHEGLGRRETGR